MSRRAAAFVAWTLVGVSMVLGFAGTGLKVAVDGVDGWHFVANDVLAIAVFLVSAVVGALVASRLPANPIGWILVGMVVSLGLSGATDGYVALSVDRDRLDGAVAWAAWYSANVFLAFLGTLFFVLLLFPNGRLLTRRWRFVAWAGSAALVLIALAVTLRPGQLDDYPRVTSPAAVDIPSLRAIEVPAYNVFVVALLCAVVSVVIRFRRARGVERQQLTVFAAAAGFAAAAFVANPIAQTLSGSQDLGVAITLVGLLAIPLAIGVAMLRYRLYEADRVISRTLVYGSLTVILGAAYAGLVLAGQAVFSSFAGGSDLAIAGSTLVVAALFLPLRSRLQRLVDRRFYRRRYDAQRTLEAFGSRLREHVELDGLRADLDAVVHETLQPAQVSLWLRSEARP